MTDFRPDPDGLFVLVHMGFGALTHDIEFVCRDSEERQGKLEGSLRGSLKLLLDEELDTATQHLPVADRPAITDETAYGSFQFTIRYEKADHLQAVLSACERAARLWWGKHNMSRNRDVKARLKGKA